MRLFSNKSTTISRDVATSPRYPRSPLWCKSPQNVEEQWQPSPRGEDPRGDPSVRGISESESEEPPQNPYALNRVLTAQGYNSDDSDAELEKAPSRYDLTENQEDDMGWDDLSNDKYSQIAKRLAAMSDDSDSVRPMWRSFDDEYDDVDVADAAPEEEPIDPFLIDPNDRDWEDTRGEEDTPSLIERRDGPVQGEASTEPVRETARNMDSMVDHVDEAESHDDEEGSTLSESLMNSIVTKEDQAYLTTAKTEDQDDRKQDHEDPPAPLRKVKVVEQGQPHFEPPTPPRRMADASSPTSSSKMPESEVQAAIIQQVTEELHKKKTSSQKDARISAALQKQGKKDRSRRKIPSSPRGFGLFRRNSKRSMKLQAAQEEDRDDQPPPRSASRKQEAESAAGYSENFEDYDDSYATEQHLSVPAHTSAPSPRGILKTASFSVAPPTVDTGAESSNPTGVVDKDLCDEGDPFCGLFSNMMGHEGDKTVDGSKSEAFTEYTTQTQLLAEVCGEKNAKYLGNVCGKRDPNDTEPGDNAGDDIPKTISPVKRTKKAAVQIAPVQPTYGGPEDAIAENRSVTEEAVVDLDSAIATQPDKNEPILVTCLRDNNMSGAAQFLMGGVRRVDTLGCQQNYEFLDDALQAEDPKVDPVITGGSSVVEAGTLLLDDKNQQRRMRRKPKQQENGGDVFFDELPIRTIEIPSSVILDSDAVSDSYSSLGGRRKTDLFVDTQLEQDIQQMQAELDRNDRRKKKSLFGRMKRAKQRRDRNDY